MILHRSVFIAITLGASSVLGNEDCRSEDETDEDTSLLQIRADWNRSTPKQLSRAAVSAGWAVAKRLTTWSVVGERTRKEQQHRLWQKIRGNSSRKKKKIKEPPPGGKRNFLKAISNWNPLANISFSGHEASTSSTKPVPQSDLDETTVKAGSGGGAPLDLHEENHTSIDQPGKVSEGYQNAIGVAKAHLQHAQTDLQKGLKQAKDGVKNTLHVVSNELLGSVQEVWKAGREAMKGVASMGAGGIKLAKVSSEAINISLKDKVSEKVIDLKENVFDLTKNGKSLAEAAVKTAVQLPEQSLKQLAGLVTKADKSATAHEHGDKAHAQVPEMTEEAIAFAKGMAAVDDSYPGNK